MLLTETVYLRKIFLKMREINILFAVGRIGNVSATELARPDLLHRTIESFKVEEDL